MLRSTLLSRIQTLSNNVSAVTPAATCDVLDATAEDPVGVFHVTEVVCVNLHVHHCVQAKELRLSVTLVSCTSLGVWMCACVCVCVCAAA